MCVLTGSAFGNPGRTAFILAKIHVRIIHSITRRLRTAFDAFIALFAFMIAFLEKQVRLRLVQTTQSLRQSSLNDDHRMSASNDHNAEIPQPQRSLCSP